MTEDERISYLKTMEHAEEIICTLQILHILESTESPLWFNNGLTEYKGTNNDHFLHAEGRLGGSRWTLGRRANQISQ